MTLLFPFLLIWQAVGAPAASIRRIFGAEATVSALAAGADTVLRVARADTLLGFALVRAVKGKDQPITFLVAIDTADRLKDIDSERAS